MELKTKTLLLFLTVLMHAAFGNAQTLYINEVMPVNRTVLADEDGEYQGWIELHNASDSTIDLTGYGLSNDNGKTRKWIITSGTIWPGGYLYIFASGKNRTGQLSRHWETIIDWGDIWKYRPGDSEPPADWNTLDFDDSTWLEGPSGFGYLDDDDSTVIPLVQSVYVRKTFTVEDPEDVTDAVLHVDYDDGFVAYLNGTEIARANLGNPGERPRFDRWARDNHEALIYAGGTPSAFQIRNLRDILLPGKNVLAIQNHTYQFLIASTDMTLIPFLTLGLKEAPQNPTGVPGLLQNFPSGLHTSFTIGTYGDTLLLTNSSGETIDQFIYYNVPFDRSVGFKRESTDTLFYLSDPTPAAINTPGGDYTRFVASSLLPLVCIDTHGKNIPNSPKMMADMGVIFKPDGQRNRITEPFNNYDDKIGIELRGSSSISFSKQQYAVETRDSTGANNNVSLMGLPEENDWVLYAPYSDKSLIRNVLEFTIGNELGWYTSRSRLCELILNGGYQGVYVLFEKIKRDKNRVNIAELKPEDIAGDQLTGGYIIKIDKTTGDETGGWKSSFPPTIPSYSRILFQYHDPEPSEIGPEQQAYIQDFMYRFERILWNTDFSDNHESYSKYINVASFIDHFILTEIGKNVDGYRLSTFMYKDRDSRDGKLTMGPLWDFNLAFGNADYDYGQYTWGWQINWPGVKYTAVPFWWEKLLSDNAFNTKLTMRWEELRADILSESRLFALIDSLTRELEEAQVRNFNRWPVLGVELWPNYFVGNTYEEEIVYLKQWLHDRLIWIDANISGFTDIGVPDNDIASPGEFILYQNYPNPFNSTTAIRYILPVETKKFVQSGTPSVSRGDVEGYKVKSFVTVCIYNCLGQRIETLVSEPQSAGEYVVKWYASDIPSGVYYYQLIVNSRELKVESQIRKMIVIK